MSLGFEKAMYQEWLKENISKLKIFLELAPWIFYSEKLASMDI